MISVETAIGETRNLLRLNFVSLYINKDHYVIASHKHQQPINLSNKFL